MKIDTDPNDMLRAAKVIAASYSGDPNILGVLLRLPVPDDLDFPHTCDVELALIVDDPVAAANMGRFLSRQRLEDVLADVCAIPKQWLLEQNLNPLLWILSLGDPRSFEIISDNTGGGLSNVFANFKQSYLASAALRVNYWLTEAKRRLVAATNKYVDPILWVPETMHALVYVTCALLDTSGRSYAGSFLKLPRNIRWVGGQLEEELREHLPSADKDPIETARMIPPLVSKLAAETPPISRMEPKDAAETQYNLSPLEAEYRAYVAEEISKADPLTGLWYARAWSTYLVTHYGEVTKKVTGKQEVTSQAFAAWKDIMGNPNPRETKVFVEWANNLYGLCIEACQELGLTKNTTSNANPLSI